MKTTYYSILEVTETASIDAIRGSYRYLTQRWHPDKNIDQRERSEQITKQLNEAYDVLSDKRRRDDYDKWLSLQRKILVEPEMNNESHSGNADSFPMKKRREISIYSSKRLQYFEFFRVFLVAVIAIFGLFASLAGLFIFENSALLGGGLFITGVLVAIINKLFELKLRIKSHANFGEDESEFSMGSWVGSKKEWSEWYCKILGGNGKSMNLLTRIIVCVIVYFLAFIANSVYRDLNNMYPSPATGAQIGFFLALIFWIFMPRKK